MHHALAMVDGARKVEGGDHLQSRQIDAIAMAFIDLEADQAGAVAVGRVGHELTGTPWVAAAILDVLAFNEPISPHDRTPHPMKKFLQGHRITTCLYRPSRWA